MRRLASILSVLLLAACASYGGRGLVPGQATLDDVLGLMGEPALRWQNPDRSSQLSYPRGPAGVHSYMVFLDAQGRLLRIENVLDGAHFARIRQGMGRKEVLRLLGPAVPGWTVYFAARDELVWEWRYCDDWNNGARFDVLFDGASGKVRSTMSATEDQRGACDDVWCRCAH